MGQQTMTLMIALSPEMEESLRRDADLAHVPVEEIAASRLKEAELLRRIFAYFPPAETREMRSLVRRRQSDALRPEEARRLSELARWREEKNAERLADLLALAGLRGVPVRQLMAELGIRPYRMR
jgi:hypothetical protein